MWRSPNEGLRPQSSGLWSRPSPFMSNHWPDRRQNRAYSESKYSDDKPFHPQRNYGQERTDLLVQISGPDRDWMTDPR